MKTQVFTQKQTLKTFGFIVTMLALFTSNSSYGQTRAATETTSTERTVKGVISNEKGPIKDVNITLQGARNGTTTNENGEFTFPIKLKTGDVLLISYIGYETQKFEIKEDTTFIKLVLTEDMIEMIGALDSNKPYKSKRKN
ncbi:carboxypeptidase-like regulatory domain-containing protein [Winogradskyella ouciana]|uniref:carboxypeptidase-like regulatory domain-containing protein n=1 Tax=Winogradskyella ouciana TaxID=2608631 RepID=UPI003D2969F2